MRAVVSLVARYRSPTTFEYANESCSDVSVGGMFILSAAPAPAGTLLKLECDTDSGNAEAKIRGVARVVWLRREPSEHGPAGMGVKFVKLEAGSRELIETIVQRLAEAGVQARSVSAAPEQRLAAAAGGGATAFSAAEPAAAPSPVKLVPSTPPAAAESREPTDRGEAARGKPLEKAEPIAGESVPKPAPGADDLPGTADAPAAVAAAEEARSSLGATGSSRPPAKASRFGWKFWVGAVVLILIAIAIADRRHRGSEQTPVAPETHVSDTEPAPAAASPPPSAASPTPAPRPAEPAAEPAPTAQQPKAAEPAPAEPTPEAAAVEAKSAVAAPSGAASDAAAPLFPSVPGQPDYVVEFVSQPNGASVTIDEKTTLVTPATINLGAMPDRIKVTAKKAGFKSSSIWMKRDGFELKAGALKRRAYITLREEPTQPQ